MFCYECRSRYILYQSVEVGNSSHILRWLAERGGLHVIRWLIENSAYQPWQSIMVSHRAVDTIIDCQDLYAEQKGSHLVTRRTWSTTWISDTCRLQWKAHINTMISWLECMFFLHCQVNDDATRARMRKAFDEMDQDGSGALSPEELKVMLYRAGYNASDKMMQVRDWSSNRGGGGARIGRALIKWIRTARVLSVHRNSKSCYTERDIMLQIKWCR